LIVAELEDADACHGPGCQLSADAGCRREGTRRHGLGSADRDTLVKTSTSVDRAVPQLLQPAEKLGLVPAELSDKRSPLILEQISALGHESGSATPIEQLAPGGDKRLHDNTLPG
jgi:hypothetical protein